MLDEYLRYFSHTKYTWDLTNRQWLGVLRPAPPGYGRYEAPGNDLVPYGNGYAITNMKGERSERQKYVKP